MKFSGPKVWSQIPTEIKEIGFRKPFTKKMKNHLMSILADKSIALPITFWRKIENEQQTTPSTVTHEFSANRSSLLSLTEIFENDSDTSEFLGFINDLDI